LKKIIVEVDDKFKEKMKYDILKKGYNTIKEYVIAIIKKEMENKL